MTGKAVENHPQCRRYLLGVYGPVEKQHRIVLTKDRGVWCWRYKRARERHYVYVGPVSRYSTLERLFEEIRLIELVGSIY